MCVTKHHILQCSFIFPQIIYDSDNIVSDPENYFFSTHSPYEYSHTGYEWDVVFEWTPNEMTAEAVLA